MTEKRKIMNINDARKHATVTKKDTRNGASSGNAADAYQKALYKQRGARGLVAGGSGKIRWFHYLQLIALLALVALLMRACNG